MFRSQNPSRRLPRVQTDRYQHRESIYRILFDLGSLTLLLIAALIAQFVAVPFTRGFSCSDASIRYPDKDDTVPIFVVIILSLGVPLVFMWLTEVFKQSYFTLYPKQPFVTNLQLCGSRNTSVSAFIRNLYMLTVIFIYGYLATWLLTEISKNFVGELRPNFLAVCRPTGNCSTVTSLYEFNAYRQEGLDYTCQNTDDSAVQDTRRSFFSGHTSFMFYGFAWLIMYIHVAWSWRHIGILGHILQVGLAVLASYVAYSRISDFQHHWYDVLVGAIVGSLIAFVAFKFILNWYKHTPPFLPYIVKSQSAGVVPASTYPGGFGNSRHISTFSDYAQIRRY